MVRPSARPAARFTAELAEVLRTGLFAVVLWARSPRAGLALRRIQHRLAQQGIRVGVTSLSYWQRGYGDPTAPSHCV
ncbi:hypothetical protein [Streptomyces murinus]|uniref:hypothetical protein n=1 Tax=Streptomyces murinus TaxID=33900 RepID=UPI0038192A74